MFYQENVIKSHLTCQMCKYMFIDPRVMPCGHSFCHDCIVDNGSRCVTCDTSHEMPVSGFILNSTLAGLLAEQPKQVNQSSKVKELRDQLNSLFNQHAKLNARLVHGSGEIKEHCQRLKVQIDVAVETRIEETRKVGEDLKQEVDEYEKKCHEHFDPNSDSLNEDIKPTLARALKFYSRTNKFLTQHEFEEKQVAGLIEETKTHALSLANKDRRLTKYLFKDYLMAFEEDLSEPSYFGHLKSEKQLVWETDSHNIVDFMSYTCNGAKLAELVYIKASRDFVGIFASSSILLVSRRYFDGSPVGKDTAISNSGAKSILCASELDNKIFLAIKPVYSDQLLRVGEKTIFIGSSTQVIFILLDSNNLNLIKYASISTESNLIATNSSSIFLFDEKKHKLVTYTTDLDESSSEILSDIPLSCTGIRANDEFVFFVHFTDGILIWNIDEECLENQLHVDAVYPQIVLTDHFLTVYSNVSSTIVIFDRLNGFEDKTSVMTEFHKDIKKNQKITSAGSDVLILFNRSGLVTFLH